MILFVGVGLCACSKPIVILSGDKILDPSLFCSCVDGEFQQCSCILPEKTDIKDYWLVGKEKIAEWGEELQHCSMLREGVE